MPTSKGAGPRPRRLPQRTCVICRTCMPKRNLVRVVRTPEGRVIIDARGKAAGRGAYLCPRPECFGSNRARAAVARALAVELGADDWAALQDELRSLALQRGASPGPASEQPVSGMGK